MRVPIVVALTAIVAGGGGIAETHETAAFPECALISDTDDRVIELRRPAEELNDVGVEVPDTLSEDTDLVVDDGVLVSVEAGSRGLGVSFRITSTNPGWAMFNGLRVGLSREDTLSIIPLEYDQETLDGKTLAFANPSFRGNLLDMCMNEITFDSADRIEAIEIRWTPMSISPASPPRVPLPTLD